MRFEATVITSRQNPLVMRAARLDQKKFRDAEGCFLIHGLKLTEEAFRAGVEICEVLVREDAADRAAEVLAAVRGTSDCRCFLLGESAFSKISPEKSPEGVICIAKALDKFHKNITIKKGLPEILPSERLLLLESLRDPGNLGTVLRSAAAFGVGCILLSADCAELYNPRTLRAGMGAVFKLPTLRVDDMAETISVLRANGRRVWATALNRSAVRLDALSLGEGDCFLIGNEGHGLSDAVIAAADGAVFIPMRENSESLNAAAAAAVCLWEQARRFGV